VSKRCNQIAAICFLFLGIFVIWESRILKYYTSLGPGAGFLPFWVGIAFVILACVLLAQVTWKPAGGREEDLLPNRAGGIQVLSILGSLVLCVILLTPLGFSLTMFCFLLFLLLVPGRQGLLISLIIALAGRIGVHYVFEYWLGVSLPKSAIPFLKGLRL